MGAAHAKAGREAGNKSDGFANRLREKHASRLDAAKSRRKANVTRRDERKASRTKRRAAHTKARDERKASRTKKHEERRASRGMKKGAANKMEHQGPKASARKAYGKSSSPSARKAFESRMAARKSKGDPRSKRHAMMSKLGKARKPAKRSVAPRRRGISRRAGSF